MRHPIRVLPLLVCLAGGLFGQTSSLNGTVSDPTGAVIPNAAITIVNSQTGFQRSATSDEQGRYNIAQVAPGTYKLTAKVAGFTDVNIAALELAVNQPATVPIVFEKLGSTSTTIAVDASAVQVNTTDATLGNAITNEAIVELPLFARNVAGLLAFQPGVTADGAVNGGKMDQANVTLDGVDVNNQNTRAAFTSVLRVTLDSVQEFRTTTTNANSDQGRSSGAQVALITKSGTNQLHGSLYELRRGTETAANDYFNNLSGIKRPFLLINVFGGSVSGPVKQNKVFYFFNFEGRRDASAASATRTVPSNDLRRGIIHYKNTAGGISDMDAAAIQAQDPAHIGINKASMDVFNQYPAPNDTTLGDGLNFVGYRFNAPQQSVQNTYIAKFDWQVDNNGRHLLFWRGQLQNDWANGLPQFPGQAPASVTLNNSKGYAVGYTATISPSLVSSFRYGLTRQGTETSGVLSAGYTSFRNLSTIGPITTGTTRIIPVHTIGEDLSWTHHAHDVKFGAIVRFINNGSKSTSNSFSNATTNVSWLVGTGADLQPANLLSSFRTSFTDVMAATLGIVSQGTAKYNYLVDGSVLAQGAPVARDFRNQEYEWYVQDTWRVSRNLTVTLGLRHSLMPPIYEANGQQTSALPGIGDWFYQRANLAAVGLPQSMAPPISYVLANSKDGVDLYPNHLRNFAPRVAIAYSPQGTSGLSKFLFGGPGKTSVRAGWGMFYDLIGQPLAQTYANSALGFSTSLSNPPNALTSINAPRFTSFSSIPAGLLPAAPKGGFPQVAPDLFAITNSIDNTLKSPYTINMNLSVGRDLGHGFYVQGAYVGRLSRASLINKDLAEPTNLVDPKSGQSYFQAASRLAALASVKFPVSAVEKMPFFENLFPGLASSTLSATQVAFNRYAAACPDCTGALQLIDQNCSPSCSIFGPYAMFNKQYSALSAWSSVGKGNYHSMQWTARKRFSEGLLFDFNFTYSKSMDLASSSENGGSFSGLIQNAWSPHQMWAPSDYDSTFIANMYAVWQLPVGRRRHFLSGAGRAVDTILGGWELTPTIQRSSGQPVSVGNGRNWPTDWNITPFAMPLGTAVTTSPTKNAPAVAGAGGPNLFPDPNVALAQYTFDLPGQSGERNVLRAMGAFSFNLGVNKSFRLFTRHDRDHTLQFRWETFNVTNTARFTTTTPTGASSLSLSLGNAGTFGKYSATAGPRQMQFQLRYSF
jgi:hypothetical protein